MEFIKVFSKVNLTKIVNTLSNFLILIIITHFLSLRYVGAFFVFLSLMNLFSTLLDLGSTVILNKHYFKEKSDLIYYLIKIIFLIYILLLPLIFFLSKFFISITFKNYKYILFIFLAYLYSLLQVYTNIIYQKRILDGEYNFIKKFNLISPLLKIFFSLFSFFGFYYLILGYGIYLLIRLMIISKFNFKFKKIIKAKPKVKKLEFLKANFVSAVGMLYGWIDSIIVGSLLGFNQVALYNLAIRIINSYLHVFDIIPITIKKIHSRKINLTKIFLYSLFIFLLFELFWLIFGKFIILEIFGKDYLQSYYLTLYLSLIILFYWRQVINTYIYVNYGYFYSNLGIIILVLSNSILDIILIKIYGLIGAILATIISIFLQSIFYLIVMTVKSADHDDGVTS